jgi:hypothetical protein
MACTPSHCLTSDEWPAHSEASHRIVAVVAVVAARQALVEYTSLGKGKGGARLQRPPPRLRPPARAVPSFTYSSDLRARVLDTYHAECATSPHAGDLRRKRLAKHVYVTAQALIVMSGLEAIYNAHLRRYPMDKGKISFSGFKDLKPWYAIFGDRQTCLCKWCENFLCYQDALRLAASYLAPLLPSGDGPDGGDDSGDGDGPDAAADDSGDDDGADSGDDRGTNGGTVESRLAKLVCICQLKSKQMFVNEFVCGGSIQDAKPDCIMQKCKCSFQVFWADLRKELVDAYGKLRPGVDKASTAHNR